MLCSRSYICKDDEIEDEDGDEGENEDADEGGGLSGDGDIDVGVDDDDDGEQEETDAHREAADPPKDKTQTLTFFRTSVPNSERSNAPALRCDLGLV